ncbi:hypothetical protein [Streptosporangium sp. NPDC051022]|uniref:hypothetical protein n=1 Tax=Streptosporangium sp. NPDC051022 TaxID=3155752 RepID=UPI0034139E8C
MTAAEPIKSVVEALEYAQAFQDIAAFLTANPRLAERATVRPNYVMIYVTALLKDDPVGFIMDAARLGLAAGARVEEYANQKFGGVHLHFGPVYVQVYTEAKLVCSQVVVGQVPDVRHALTFNLDGSPREAAQAVAQ